MCVPRSSFRFGCDAVSTTPSRSHRSRTAERLYRERLDDERHCRRSVIALSSLSQLGPSGRTAHDMFDCIAQRVNVHLIGSEGDTETASYDGLGYVMLIAGQRNSDHTETRDCG